MTETELKPIVESLVYLAEEPVTEASLLAIVGKEHKDLVRQVLEALIQEYQTVEHGIEIKEVANGYKMATKAEHHEWVRKYVKHQTPPTRLSLPALETLAVIAYKQPITIPEIQEIRGVNAVGVLKTLLDKSLVTPSGRKNVIGRPILYKTTKEFLMHFGLKNLEELPSLEEFEELAQSALGSGLVAPATPPQTETPTLPEGSPGDSDSVYDAPEDARLAGEPSSQSSAASEDSSTPPSARTSLEESTSVIRTASDAEAPEAANKDAESGPGASSTEKPAEGSLSRSAESE